MAVEHDTPFARALVVVLETIVLMTETDSSTSMYSTSAREALASR